MPKKLFLLISLFAVFSLFFSCSTGKKSDGSQKPEVKKGVAPVADAEVAVIDTDYGKITVEFYSNIAPEAVKRFKELAREGVYNGTNFHRVNATVVQGGDPLSKDDNPANDGTGQSDKPDLAAELSDLQYDTGILGAARSQNYNSANSQFFIMLKREPQFDTEYTIFGKVIDGMSTVRTIAGAQRDRERPLDPVKIKTVTIQAKK